MTPERGEGAAAGAELRLADLAECLWKPFRGPRVLRRMLVGFAVSLVPLAGSCVFGGYFVRVTRQTLGSGPQPIPGWTDIQSLIGDGLRMFALTFVCLLVMLPLFAAPPLIFLGSYFLFPALVRENPLLLAGAVIILELFLLPLLLGPLLLLPSAILHLAVGGLGRAFALRRQLRTLRRHWRAYWRFLMFFGLVQIPVQILAQLPVLLPMWDRVTSGALQIADIPDLWPPSPWSLAAMPLAIWGTLVCASALGLAGQRMGLTLASDHALENGGLAVSANPP